MAGWQEEHPAVRNPVPLILRGFVPELLKEDLEKDPMGSGNIMLLIDICIKRVM